MRRKQRFRIFCERTDGTVFEAFTWTGSLQSGVARAWADADAHGVPITHAWGIVL